MCNLALTFSFKKENSVLFVPDILLNTSYVISFDLCRGILYYHLHIIDERVNGSSGRLSTLPKVGYLVNRRAKIWTWAV